LNTRSGDCLQKYVLLSVFIIAVQETLDDILFEYRNKEYGSYRLRKQYMLRLAIGFICSLTLILLLTLSYFWYLNSAGDESVYLYPYGGVNLKSTQGNMMDPKELRAYLDNSAAPVEKRPDAASRQEPDKLQNFKVVENAANDTFKPVQEEIAAVEDPGTGLGLSNDSTVFGGFLLGNGDGMGSGSDLDRFPLFPGGLEAVRRFIELNVKYPPQAIKQKIHGVVLVSFDVNKQGDVDNIKVERSINPMIDAEAIKAIQTMPRWKPGMRHGKPVIVKFIIPVNFMPLS
jgi:periplasmic protein TonB